MIEKELVNIFDECVDRLAAGQTIEDCLRQYPQHATQLRPMLEVGLLTRRVVPPTAEVIAAQDRVRQRVETVVQTMPPQRQPVRLFTQRIATLAASLVLVFLIAVGGGATLAQDSLPGDFLYGMKLLTENVRLAVAPDVFGLTAEFNQRRVDETRQLITFKRQAELEFEGSVSVIDANTWEIAGLPMSVPAGLGAQVQTGDKVRVRVETTTNGEIHIVEIVETEHLAPPATPMPPPTVVPSHTPTATLTVTSSHTPAPTETPSSTPTATLTVTSSHTPSHTPTPTETPSNTPTVTATTTKTPTSTRTPILLVTNTFAPSQTPSPTPDVCVPQRPDRWQTYRIQAGDTLSGLAASRGVLLSRVMAVNCLVDAGFIVVGQELFLPIPLATALPPSSGDNGQPGNGSDNSNNNSGNGNSNDNGNDNDDDHKNDNDD